VTAVAVAAVACAEMVVANLVVVVPHGGAAVPAPKVMRNNSTDLPQCPSTYRERQLGVGASTCTPAARRACCTCHAGASDIRTERRQDQLSNLIGREDIRRRTRTPLSPECRRRYLVTDVLRVEIAGESNDVAQSTSAREPCPFEGDGYANIRFTPRLWPSRSVCSAIRWVSAANCSSS